MDVRTTDLDVAVNELAALAEYELRSRIPSFVPFPDGIEFAMFNGDTEALVPRASGFWVEFGTEFEFRVYFEGTVGVPVDRVVLVQYGRRTDVEWRFGGEAMLPDPFLLGLRKPSEGEERLFDPPAGHGGRMTTRNWLIERFTAIPFATEERAAAWVDVDEDEPDPPPVVPVNSFGKV